MTTPTENPAGNAFRAFRARKDLDEPMTQEDLAQMIGVDQSYVSNVERGKRNVSYGKAREIESITGISKHALRPDVFGPEPNPPDSTAA
jgi:transcriptional regulator with XRE-family HTH domain